MYSAGVNAALAQFFGIADTEVSNTPSERSNTLSKSSSTPSNQHSIIPNISGNIPTNIPGNIPGNILSEAFAVEVMPGK
jgi:hypothetical protein